MVARRRRVANPLAFAVLGCLVERPMHPYEISTILRSRGKDQSIKLNYGSLYSVVGALEKHGLITARETVREGNRPERTVYEITDAGRAEFEDWLAELLGTPVREFAQLEAGLAYMAGLPPDRVAELLEQRAKALQASVDEVEAVHASPELAALPRMFWVESEFRLALLKAELQYVTTLAGEIRADTLEGSRFWRRGFELTASGEVTFAEIFADPERYLGKEAGWLRQMPRESL